MELRNSNLADDPCARLEELLPAYGMGLSDPDEVAEVEALLEQCPEMASDLEEYRQLAAYLPMTSEARSAPAHLLTQILVAAASDSDQLEFTGPGATPATRRVPRLKAADVATARAGNDSHSEKSHSMESHSMQTVKTSRLPMPNDVELQPATVIPFDRTPAVVNKRWRNRTLFSTVAAVLALVLFIGSNLFWASRLNQQETTIAEVQDLLETFGENQVVRFNMDSMDEAAPQAGGTVWCHPENKVAVIQAINIPEEAQDQDLKVWLWHGDEREEAGDVWINDRGEGTAVVTASKPMSNYDYIVIAQASEATSDHQPRPFVHGNLYYTAPADTEDPPA
jgi:anti-sigma factor RsiW